jgi:serine/threonine-protein kinase
VEVTCSHCGYEHPDETSACPRTQERMNVPGLIGGRVDRYEVIKLIGAGGFGSVYRAKHVHTDAEVALKVLKRSLNADQAMLDRFLREAKAAAAVGSEHIVRVLDAGVAQDGTAFLAMELLDGWDLKELIAREGPLTPQRLVSLMAQVLEGLSAAHAKGIVHRDMKPANVFVVRQGEKDFVKLLDFGISKMHSASPTEVGGLTMTGVAMGTPAYMAPEQFFDARNVDGRADLYSVATMLYELLGRRLPFDAQSYAELIVKVRTETPKPLLSLVPQLPASLAAAVDKGLAREKDARWASATEFASAITSTPVPASAVPARPLATLVASSTPQPLESSLMFGKTATPHRVTPAPDSGWVGGQTPMPANTMPTPAPAPSQPTPMPAQRTPAPMAVQQTPMPVAPGPLQQTPMAAQQTPVAAQQAQKASATKVALLIFGVLGGLMVLCCILSAIANAANQHPQ